jgi:hypothetical protein
VRRADYGTGLMLGANVEPLLTASPTRLPSAHLRLWIGVVGLYVQDSRSRISLR